MEARNERIRVVVGLFFILWLPTIVWGISGKLQGVVRDSETGQPIFRIQVALKGTELVCLTDKQGKYVLFDVPAGKQTLVISHEGYKQKKVKNLMVYPDQTTNHDITLTGIQKHAAGREVVVPEKAWIENKDGYQVWSVRWEDIEKLPVRELSEVVALFPGIVPQEGDFHIRGGRSDENGWLVDDVSVRLPTSGGLGLKVIPNTIEQVSFWSGYDATMGLGISGEIAAVTKRGRSGFHLTGEVISDDFWAMKSQNYEILGIDNLYSYGYDDYVLSVSGPISWIQGLCFYVAGRRLYQASPATRFEGWKQDSQVISRGWSLDNGSPWHKVVEDSIDLQADIPPGRLPGGGQATSTISGNVVWAHQPFNLRLGGSYSSGRAQQGASGDPLDLYVTPVRGRRYRFKEYSGYLSFKHQVTPTLHYNLNLSMFSNNSRDGDPIWWNDLLKPGSPRHNKAIVDTGQVKRFVAPIGVAFQAPGVPVGSFNKFDESSLGGKLDVFKQFGKNVDVTLGGEVHYYTVRRYSIETINMLSGLASAALARGTTYQIPDYWIYHWYGAVQNIGYDIYGDKIDESQTYQSNVNEQMLTFNGHDEPPHPITAGGYIQGRIELSDLILNGGIRFDFFDTGTERLRDWREIQKDNTGFIHEESFGERASYRFLSPRLGVSLPLSDQNVFHAHIGKYVTMPRFSDLFESWGYFAHSLFSGDKRQFPNPNLKPVKLTQYEVGWQQQFGRKSSLGITAFYRTYRDLTMTGILESNVRWYDRVIITQNDGYSNLKGLSFNFYLYRQKGIMLTANYTLSQVNGTGSTSTSHFAQASTQTESFLPVLVAPLDFDQRHRGTIDVDIRSQPNAGPRLFGKYPLGNLGLNLLFTFHSGTPYTRIQSGDAFSQVFDYQAAQAVESPNASNLSWIYQLDAKLDKSFSIGMIDFNVYLWVINLLDTKSVTAVFRQTGRPDSDGFLATGKSKDLAAWYPDGEAEWQRWYQALLTNCGTFGWQAPRQVRLGVKFELK